MVCKKIEILALLHETAECEIFHCFFELQNSNVQFLSFTTYVILIFFFTEMLFGFLFLILLQSAMAQWGRLNERAFYIHLNGTPVSFKEAKDKCEKNPAILGQLWVPRTVETHILTYVKRILIPDLSKYGKLR